MPPEQTQDSRETLSRTYALRATDMARRGLTVCWHNGEPHPYEPGEWCPPDGATSLAGNDGRLEERYFVLVRALRQVAADLSVCATAFQKIDDGTEATPPHCRANDAERALKRVVDVLRDYVEEND